jgi:uncharacterized protein
MSLPLRAVDLVLLLAMIVSMTVEVHVFTRLTRAAAREGTDERRLRAYIYLIAYQWALTGWIAVVWLAQGRPWSVLRLGVPNFWGFGTSIALVAAFVLLSVIQRTALLQRPELSAAARRRIADVEGITPQTPTERRLWTFTALTAGVCEEVLFRGFLLALVTGLAGLAAAAVITSVLFGFFHAYYGWKGILKTGAFGLVFALLAIWSGSLIPGIVLHAAVDLIGGDVSYRVLTQSTNALG